MPFHYRELKSKSRKSRDTYSNRQVWPRSTKCSSILPGEHIGRSKHHLPAIKDDSTHGHHQMVNTTIRLIVLFTDKMEKLYTNSKIKTRS